MESIVNENVCEGEAVASQVDCVSQVMVKILEKTHQTRATYS